MKRSALIDGIRSGVESLGQTLPPGADEKLAMLVEELERWGRRINLTAIRDAKAMISGHILDSLAVRPFLNGRRIIDIGTGAGFPGLPLAIAEPELEFVLLDSNGKKLSFVRHITALLGLPNVATVKSRAEDYAPGERFDTVIARALAKTARLTELGAHLSGEGGVLLALKGKHPADELEELPAIWEYSVTELTVPGRDDHARHVITLRHATGGAA